MPGEHIWWVLDRFKGVEVVRFFQEAELKGTERSRVV